MEDDEESSSSSSNDDIKPRSSRATRGKDKGPSTKGKKYKRKKQSQPLKRPELLELRRSIRAQKMAAIKKQNDILRKIYELDCKLLIFKDKFLNSEIFDLSCENPMELIDKAAHDLRGLERTAENWIKREDISKILYALKELKSYFRQARKLWDLVNHVMGYLTQIKKDQRLIDAKSLNTIERDCHKFLKDLEKFEIFEETNIYYQLTANIDYMSICIRNIKDLDNQQLGKLLWTEMMKAAKFEYGTQPIIKIGPTPLPRGRYSDVCCYKCKTRKDHREDYGNALKEDSNCTNLQLAKTALELFSDYADYLGKELDTN